MSEIYYDGYKIPQLKDLLKKIGLSTTGKKLELIERLKNDDIQEKKNSGLIVLYCKTIIGSYYTIWINRNDSIISLKEKIKEKSGIPVEKQRLEIENYITKKRSILDDDLTIDENYLYPESIIFIYHIL